MITVRKKVFAAGTPAIFAAVFLAAGLGAVEFSAGDTEAGQTVPLEIATTEQMAPAPAQPVAHSGKGDLKVDLADVHSRPMRCVSGYGKTTCTGWPVSYGMIAYNDK